MFAAYLLCVYRVSAVYSQLDGCVRCALSANLRRVYCVAAVHVAWEKANDVRRPQAPQGFGRIRLLGQFLKRRERLRREGAPDGSIGAAWMVTDSVLRVTF